MTNSFYNSIVLLLISVVLTFLATWFWRVRSVAVQRLADEKREREQAALQLAVENKALVASVTEMQAQLGLLKQAVLPISTAFQAILIKELTHFHTPEMDALMVKLGPPVTLSVEEEQRLAVMLRERAKDMATEISESERDAAHILPYVVKRAKIEQANLAIAPTELQIVSVVPVNGVVDEEKERS